MAQFKIWLLILLATVLTYLGSLKYGFSQDDWYFLLISGARSLGDVLGFFNPLSQSGFAFYRPLGTQLYYFLFNQHPYLMHIFMLLLQSLNGYLVYLLLKSLKLKAPTPLLVGLLYSVSSVHFLSLYYIAATQQLLAATFSLLSLIFFLRKRYWPSALLFSLGLMSKETAITVPLIAFGLTILTKTKLSIRPFFPYTLVFVLYLLMRLLTSSTTQSEYHLFFGPSVITNLRWYFLFAANIPEALVSYGLPRMGINLSGFVLDHKTPGLILLLCSGSLTLLALSRLVVTRAWQYLVWFIVGLGPVTLLKDHLYPHYLDLALIPFLLLLIQDLKPRTQYLVAGFYLLVSIYSVGFSQSHHWTTGRAIITQQALSQYDWQNICTHSNIVFLGEGSAPRELSYALSMENGPRVICANPDLLVSYHTPDTLALDRQGDTMPEDLLVIDIGSLAK